MRSLRTLGLSALLSLSLVAPAFAADDVAKVQNFITNIITDLVTLAGLVAAGFIVYGGFIYISSSGNPERLDRAKQTIQYSGLGLAIAIGAYVLTDLVSQIATSSFK